jgi:hypothetical protein
MHPSSQLVLTKFDVAERQLHQAIRLFFDGGDPVSIHTIAEAAAQVLYDTRSQYGAESKIRDSDIIKPEYKKEWMISLAKSKNFFKHADRDPSEVHEFKEEFNHFSILDAVSMYLTAKRQWTPETITFVQWYAVTYPALVKANTEFAGVMDRYRADSSHDATAYKALCARAISELRSLARAIPGITLSPGAPSDA